MPANVVTINRAPVLTLWAAVVAERLGNDHELALTLGKAVAGLNAQSKGRRLGIFHKAAEEGGKAEAKPAPPGKPGVAELLGRQIPVVRTREGVRATVKGDPIDPQSVQTYLEKKFGDDLDEVSAAMKFLAAAYKPQELARQAFALYERFRPEVPKGEKGWGVAGKLDLRVIRALAKEAP